MTRASGEGTEAAVLFSETGLSSAARADRTYRLNMDTLETDLSALSFRTLLSQAVDVSVRCWERLQESAAFVRPPDGLRAQIRGEALPYNGRPVEQVIDRISREVAAYPLGNGHPRWWGFISGSAHPAGVAAELIAAALNNVCFPPAQIAIDVEVSVLKWLAQLIGLPAETPGLLVSGGSTANLVCLAAGRAHLKERGRASDRVLPVYASNQMHSSVAKAVRILGFGDGALRLLGTQNDFRIDVEQLEKAIARDRKQGVGPGIIVANAGTVNTGIVDPIEPLVRIARREGCWLHIDGAYGAFAASLPELKHLFLGIEMADSVAADPHKWLYVPYEAGAALVRDQQALERAFSPEQATYLNFPADSYFGGPLWFSDRGPQLSRGFRALKVWAVMQAMGVSGLHEAWRRDMAIARRVRALATKHPRLESMADSDLSIFCLRYVAHRGDLNALNRELLERVCRDGRMLLTPVNLQDRFGLRGCVVNLRSTMEDAQICIDAVEQLGDQIAAELGPERRPGSELQDG